MGFAYYLTFYIPLYVSEILNDIGLNDREHGIPVAAHHGVIQEFPNAKALDDQVGLHTGEKCVGDYI